MLLYFLKDLRAKLAALPPRITLLDYIDCLCEIFESLNATKSGADDDARQQLLDLQKQLGFESRRSKVGPGHALRVFRHMIYSHPEAIKQYLAQIQDGSKELQLDNTARLRILAAKCLSSARIPSEQRNQVLQTFSNKELEELLVTPVWEIKQKLALNIVQEQSVDYSKAKVNLLGARATSVLRVPLNRPPIITLEVKSAQLRKWRETPEHQKETLSRFLEALYDVEPDSKHFQEIWKAVEKGGTKSS